MICPNCNSVNKDNVRVCAHCGTRLSSTAMRPAARTAERKYLAVGTAAVLIAVLALVLLISAFSCMCPGCSNAGEDEINSNVEGDWSAEAVNPDADVDMLSSDADALSANADEVQPAE